MLVATARLVSRRRWGTEDGGRRRTLKCLKKIRRRRCWLQNTVEADLMSEVQKEEKMEAFIIFRLGHCVSPWNGHLYGSSVDTLVNRDTPVKVFITCMGLSKTSEEHLITSPRTLWNPVRDFRFREVNTAQSFWFKPVALDIDAARNFRAVDFGADVV